MARIRTVPQALKEIKEMDPSTALTYNALRNWVRSGKIPHVKAGSTPLVDLDVILNIVKGVGNDGN